ncbi:hypothetical protein MSAN_02473600 [Mycena sanguinolenta]|uniref:Uncharacterized protein n=1 Tax=Mycena sanguinolenta TaxID=230812 RepID=A0A8H6U2V5_9AGAR|nr:hypothetical protein MSAN_02473600 [Mycena sanguinolenta]
MSTIPETSLSILSQSNPPSTTWTFTGILLAISAATAAVYYASPTHLTHVLVSALADTERAYLAAAENGVLCVSTADVAGEALHPSTRSLCPPRSLPPQLPLSALHTLRHIQRAPLLRCLTMPRRGA